MPGRSGGLTLTLPLPVPAKVWAVPNGFASNSRSCHFWVLSVAQSFLAGPLWHLSILLALLAWAKEWGSTGYFANFFGGYYKYPKSMERKKKCKEGLGSKHDLSRCASYQCIAAQLKIYPLLSAPWWWARPFKHFSFATNALLDFVNRRLQKDTARGRGFTFWF